MVVPLEPIPACEGIPRVLLVAPILARDDGLWAQNLGVELLGCQDGIVERIAFVKSTHAVLTRGSDSGRVSTSSIKKLAKSSAQSERPRLSAYPLAMASVSRKPSGDVAALCASTSRWYRRRIFLIAQVDSPKWAAAAAHP